MICTPRNSETNLKHRRFGNQTFGNHLFGESEMPEFKDFEFRFDTPLFCQCSHFSEIRWCCDVNIISVTKIQSSAIKTAYFRKQFLHMGKSLKRSNHICSGTGHRRLVVARSPITTHSGSQIYNNIGVTGTNAVYRFLEQFRIA